MMIPDTNLPISRALAIETSGNSGSVALVHDGTVLVEESFPHGLKHAAGLLPLIDRLMLQHHWKPTDLQCLFVSQGPGSFTGLRIGITLAKTLSLATGAKIVAVPSLRVLAENAPDEADHVIVILDAKRDQIFTARYERVSGKWTQVEPAHLDTLATMLDRSPRPVHLIGEGIPFHQKFLPTNEDRIIISSNQRWRAQATIVARLGLEIAAEGLFVKADQFSPLYIRQPEAEEKYDKEHGTGPVGISV